MMLEPLKVGPFTNGWQTNAKPFLLPTDGLVDILNAYPYQGRIIKRIGNQFMGRLRRLLTGESLNVTLAQDFYNNGTTPTAIDIFETLLDITTAAPLRSTEPNAEIERESVTITIDAGGGSETIIEDANGTGILSATATNA